MEDHRRTHARSSHQSREEPQKARGCPCPGSRVRPPCHRSGPDGLVHAFVDKPVDDAFVRLAAERKAFVIPTLTVLDSVNRGGGNAALAEDPALRAYLTADDIEMLRSGFPGKTPPVEILKIPAETVRASRRPAYESWRGLIAEILARRHAGQASSRVESPGQRRADTVKAPAAATAKRPRRSDLPTEAGSLPACVPTSCWSMATRQPISRPLAISRESGSKADLSTAMPTACVQKRRKPSPTEEASAPRGFGSRRDQQLRGRECPVQDLLRPAGSSQPMP